MQHINLFTGHQASTPKATNLKTGLAVTVASVFLAAVTAGVPVADLLRTPHASAQVQAQDGTFNVNVGTAVKDAVMPYVTDVIVDGNGAPVAGQQISFTITKPNASTVTFTQVTDAEGRIRGQIYGAVNNALGSYTISATVNATGGAFTGTTNYTVKQFSEVAANGDVSVSGILQANTFEVAGVAHFASRFSAAGGASGAVDSVAGTNGVGYKDVTISDRGASSFDVFVTPTWNTSVWITNKTNTGFRVNFGTAPTSGETFSYFIVE